MSDSIRCANCGYDHECSRIDTNNTKEVFQGTDMSYGYFDVYSTFGLCKRCNQHGLLLKIEKRKSSFIDDTLRSGKVQEMIKRLSKK